VVEDDSVVRMAVSKTLRDHGYTVFEAGNGAEAIQLCERQPEPIHLLVTDVVMPQMSGPEFVERIAPVRPEAKVLYMSAHILDTLVYRRIIEQGSPFLEKPFTRVALMRKVREVLDRDRSAAGDLRRPPP
jgi:two-component system cell cycle sensor histidine kinase/response regulator CckA